MPILIAIPMYPVSEVCGKLAEMKKRGRPYERQQIDAWIQKLLPLAQKYGNQYMLTDAEIEWIDKHTRVNKTRKKNID